PVKFPWSSRRVGGVKAVVDGRWGTADGGPVVGSGQIRDRLQPEPGAESGPGKDRVGGRACNAQRRGVKLESADVAAVAAIGVRDGSEVKDSRRAALVGGQIVGEAFVNGGTARQERVGWRRAAVVGQRTEKRIDIYHIE